MDECLERLRAEGARLGIVAATAELSAPVPGCPGWDVDALLRHIGDVHRWAAMIVRDRVQVRLRRDFAGPADRDGLLAWYGDGHAALLETLATTSAADMFWAWGDAPSPLAFWARRQAHETAIHRLDVEQAAGVAATAFPTAAAADGIDEWLMLASQRAVVPGGNARTLHVAPTDAPDRWLVQLRDDGLTIERGGPGGDCALRAPATALVALLMNRHDGAGVSIEGNRDVLRAWREHVRF